MNGRLVSVLARNRWLPSLSVLAITASFAHTWRAHILIAVMLFAPLLDRGWRPPSLAVARWNWVGWLALLVPSAILLWIEPSASTFFLNTLLFAAIPEEWYFRAYLMPRLGRGWRANLSASIAFAFLHALTRGWETAVLVFWPSLLYGYLYQRTNDIVLVMLAHGASNLVFFLYLHAYFG